MNGRRLASALVIVGACVFVVGTALIYIPAAFLFAGAFGVAVGLVAIDVERRAP